MSRDMTNSLSLLKSVRSHTPFTGAGGSSPRIDPARSNTRATSLARLQKRDGEEKVVGRDRTAEAWVTRQDLAVPVLVVEPTGASLLRSSTHRSLSSEPLSN